MADPQTFFQRGIVQSGSSPSGFLFVDADILIKFEKIGALNTLFAANRVVIITPEVRGEAVDDAIATGDPKKIASAQTIAAWIQSNRPGSKKAAS
jgi:hypothetical protein